MSRYVAKSFDKRRRKPLYYLDLDACKNILRSNNSAMPKESTGDHTPGTIEQVLIRLREITAQIEAAKTLMEMQPSITHIEVARERSLKDGLTFLTTWAESLRDSVHDSKMKAHRNNGVSGKSDTVSGSPSGAKKVRNK